MANGLGVVSNRLTPDFIHCESESFWVQLLLFSHFAFLQEQLLEILHSHRVFDLGQSD